MYRPRLPFFTVAIAITFAWWFEPAHAAEPAAAVTFVEACVAANGQQPVTAVGMRAAATTATAGPTHVVVLIDTSASQTGAYRQRAIESLTGLLEKSRPDDRFAASAVDVSSTPLADGFHAGKSDSLRKARLALDGRTPLGSTDLLAAIEGAAMQLTAVEGPRAIIYIGDGPALSGIDADDFSRVIDLLRSERISISSLGVGPHINWPCLAALASAPPRADAARQGAGRTRGRVWR